MKEYFMRTLSIICVLFLAAGCVNSKNQKQMLEEGPLQSIPSETPLPKDPQRSAVMQERARIINQQGMQAFDKRDYMRAVNLFGDAIRLHPTADYYCNLGRAYYFIGENNLAEQSLAKANEMQPNNPIILRNLGDVYRQWGDNEEAINYYHAAIKINPDFAPAHYELGNLFLKNGMFDQAEWRINRALQLQPRFDKALLARAILYYRTNRPEQSWGDIQKLENYGFVVDKDFKAKVVAAVQKDRSDALGRIRD